MRVFQFWPPKITCELEDLTGLTAETCATALRASASDWVSVCAPPAAPRAPPVVTAPGLIVNRFVPRPVRRELTDALTPWVSVTAESTAPTPTMTPRTVSSERR